MSAMVNFITFSLSSCGKQKCYCFFFGKNQKFPEVHFKGYHCFITLTEKIVITSINSVSNLVVTGPSLLGKHQMKNIFFLYLLSINQKIQFETREHYRDSEEHLTHHLQLLTGEKPRIYTDLKNQVKQIMQFSKLHCHGNHKNM